MRNIDMRQGGWCHAAMFSSQLERLRPFPELANYRTPIFICAVQTCIPAAVSVEAATFAVTK